MLAGWLRGPTVVENCRRIALPGNRLVNRRVGPMLGAGGSAEADLGPLRDLGAAAG